MNQFNQTYRDMQAHDARERKFEITALVVTLCIIALMLVCGLRALNTYAIEHAKKPAPHARACVVHVVDVIETDDDGTMRTVQTSMCE